tara:strand:+ start:368 stop:568 length:201 start_codon:yes stop_codon:yes gene_type:complete
MTAEFVNWREKQNDLGREQELQRATVQTFYFFYFVFYIFPFLLSFLEIFFVYFFKIIIGQDGSVVF